MQEKEAAVTELKVSVILPTYNRSDLIGETIESLLLQERSPNEILIIDDGSTDDTAKTLAAFGDRFQIHHQTNAGKAAALNRGLAMTIGDLVWIVDDDDVLLPTACHALAGPLEQDLALGFCAGRHLDFITDPKSGQKEFRNPGYMRDSSPESIFPDLLAGCHIFQPGMMVRRTVYENIGPFREDLMRSQDYEMLLRIARNYRGIQLDNVVFWHREHEGKRGQKGNQFSAAQNADRWAEYNRQIFSDLLAELEDNELFAQSEWEAAAPDLRPRLAQIARGSVQGRQRMWRDALSSYITAASFSERSLTPAERDLIKQATLSTLGTPELIKDRRLHLAIRALGKTGQAGSEMRSILRRSMRWQFRAAVEAKSLSSITGLVRYFAST